MRAMQKLSTCNGIVRCFLIVCKRRPHYCFRWLLSRDGPKQHIGGEFKKSRKFSIMRIFIQGERFALCSVIGASLEEILHDMKQISVESQQLCVNFNVCGYFNKFFSVFLPVCCFYFAGFFSVCAVGWQVESKLSSTNK